ncbi:hypothetical protein [Pedobacter sp. SYSU D00535]|uniref:hypothetical protein n=1 Tax=Pedobacter sp. SYSU D00535 TaxID=2810308 RepID=UPI001A968326|nr:hypothetical protein [Pedobacter sp. SYSU D00535]
MKVKVLLLFLMIGFGLTGCQKDDEDLSVAAKLKGKWKNTASYTHYYNTQGVKIYTESDDALADIEFDGKSTAKVSMTDGSIFVSIPVQYAVSETNSQDYLTLSSGLGVEKFSITSLTDSNMTLEIEDDSPEYTEGDQEKVAAKAVYIQEYRKE